MAIKVLGVVVYDHGKDLDATIVLDILRQIAERTKTDEKLFLR